MQTAPHGHSARRTSPKCGPVEPTPSLFRSVSYPTTPAPRIAGRRRFGPSTLRVSSLSTTPGTLRSGSAPHRSSAFMTPSLARSRPPASERRRRVRTQVLPRRPPRHRARELQRKHEHRGHRRSRWQPLQADQCRRRLAVQRALGFRGAGGRDRPDDSQPRRHDHTCDIAARPATSSESRWCSGHAGWSDRRLDASRHHDAGRRHRRARHGHAPIYDGRLRTHRRCASGNRRDFVECPRMRGQTRLRRGWQRRRSVEREERNGWSDSTRHRRTARSSPRHHRGEALVIRPGLPSCAFDTEQSGGGSGI